MQQDSNKFLIVQMKEDMERGFKYSFLLSYFKIDKIVENAVGVASDFPPRLGIGYIDNQQNLVYDFEEFSVSLPSFFDQEIISNVSIFVSNFPSQLSKYFLQVCYLFLMSRSISTSHL